MTNRFSLESRELETFMGQMIVICPRCGGRADVMEKANEVRLSCFQCGYLQMKQSGTKYIGGAFDVHFRLPLYLQTGCCGHVLWAYNQEHLAYMRQYVEASVRTSDGVNRSIESRLPKWMKQKHNREDVLRAIKRLELACEKG